MPQPYIVRPDTISQEWFYDHPELYLHNSVSPANYDATFWMKALYEPDDIVENKIPACEKPVFYKKSQFLFVKNGKKKSYS